MRNQVFKKLILLSLLGSLLFSGAVLADHQSWHVGVKLDDSLLDKAELRGKILFAKNCATCHGENASGTLMGPPLVHKIYNPGHHSDKSFRRAIKNGVRSHHWPYGDMPTQKQVSFGHVAPIIAFIRELQQQNGIVTEKHSM